MPLGLVRSERLPAAPARPRRRHLGLAVTLGVLALASLALVVAGLSAGPSNPNEPAVARSADRVDSIPEASAAAVPASEIGRDAPGAPEAVASPPPTVAVEEPAIEVVPTAAEPLNLPAALHVTIQTTPSGAELVVDGRAVGKSPYDLETLPGVTHSVTATAAGFVPVESSFVADAKDTQLQLDLEAQPRPSPPQQTIATPRQNGAMLPRQPVEPDSGPKKTPPPAKPAPMTPIYIDD